MGPFAPSAKTLSSQFKEGSLAKFETETGAGLHFFFVGFLPLPEYSGT